MEEAEQNIHKPLLLEEFGKIVWEKDYGKGYIEKKRNPVYEAMTGVTMDSVKKCVYLTNRPYIISRDGEFTSYVTFIRSSCKNSDPQAGDDYARTW